MSLTRKIAHNTIIQFSSKAVSIVFGVLTVGLMTRYLGTAGYGEYSTITAFLQFFAILVDFGLQLSMVNLMSSSSEEESKKIFNNALTLRITSAFVLFALAPLLALFFPYNEAIKAGMFILTLNYFALAANQVLIGLFQKELRMDKVAITEIVGRVLLLGGVYYAIISNYGLKGILVAIVFASLIQVGLLYFFSLGFNKFKLAFEKSVWRRIISDSWPIAISIAFNLIYFKADTIILSLTRTQAEVGIYSAPYRMLEILTSFPYLFVGLVFPILAKAWSEKRHEDYRNYFQKSFDLLAIIAVPIIVGTIPLANRIMVLIAGHDFADSGTVLKIIIWATGIIFLNTIFGYSIVILGKQKKLIWAYILTAILSLALYIIFIPKYSYIAASYITILAEFLMLSFNVFVSVRTSGFFPSLASIFKSIIASLAMLGSILLLYQFNIFIILPAAVVIYFTALFLIGGIKKETLNEILRIKS